MSQVEWVTLTGGYRPLMHFCLLSPCNCDGRQTGANVPRHSSPMAAGAWAAAFQRRVRARAAEDEHDEGYWQWVLTHPPRRALGSQAPRSATSPAPEAYPAWLA